ncbi:MAG TPA: M20/M25/M40 family metallo-hydrolase, partial [Beutenbergiaceae bacterium]|nr:M20/M25/M40 family metallo-hydrolase [Beutenbergiaceae bacterium]
SILSRRVDPRAGVNLTWGRVSAGTADNAIPARGKVAGTLRCLDASMWDEASALVPQIVEGIVAPLGVKAECIITRGVPPVVNSEHETIRIGAAARDVNGAKTVVLSEQSLGGEDFGWYLRERAGSMVRLGTRSPGGTTYDLHQGNIVFDERAINVGARTLATVAAMPVDQHSG